MDALDGRATGFHKVYLRMFNVQWHDAAFDSNPQMLTHQLRKRFSDGTTEYVRHMSDRLFLNTIAIVRIALECITIIYIRMRASIE